MLLAASESAVTKNPRLRLTRRRSSSLSPFGSFHNAMSRLIWISCGIQWFAHADRYFSHAHLYLNGTSWLTSVWPLMMRLSATLTRRNSAGAPGESAANAAAVSCGRVIPCVGVPASGIPPIARPPPCVVFSSNCNMLETPLLILWVDDDQQLTCPLSVLWVRTCWLLCV